jgi:assimilatory nitrate reductase catalytic subunit
VPSKPGKTAVEMFEAAADGEIKALWIACTNPAQSMPDQATVRRALQRAEFVVVQEAYATAATCDYADLLLPATTWGEKDGTVTNSERRISRVRAAVPAPGEARHDWRIVVDFARRLERALPARTRASMFPYDSPESIWLEHRESTRGRDLDITGLSYATLEQQGPQQWPFRPGESHGQERLYQDGTFPTPDGRARFAALPFVPLAEPRESSYPFSLTTGRLRDQWHGMTRTGTLGRLFGHVAEPAVQMNAQDMDRRGLKDGDLVHVTSKRGSILVPVQASPEIGLSQAFIAMHWGSEFLSGLSSTGEVLAGVNALTTSAHCPTSKQPELKHAAVKVLKAELPWALLGVAWLPEEQALSAREGLRELMAQFPFASCVPFGRERTGLLFRAAAHEAPEPALIQRIEARLGLNTADALRYADLRLGQRRTARLVREEGSTRLEGFVLAGDTRAEVWIKPLLLEGLPAAAYGRLLLMPGAKAPVAIAAKGRQVCTCFNVTEDAIRHRLQYCEGSEPARLAALQERLQCGTNCGSCLPELKRLVRETVPASATAI